MIPVRAATASPLREVKPMLMASLAFIVGFKTGLFNIGIAGQMMLSGFFFRRKKLLDSLLAYSAVLLILSVAVTNQYLAIPGAFAAAAAWPFGVLYHLLGFIPLFGKGTNYGAVYLLAVLLLILIFIQKNRNRLKEILSKFFHWLDESTWE